jgi:isoleucyl-tRNA synthetase
VLLDQWAVGQAYEVQQAVIAAYERYDFPEIVQRVQNFCTNEMGALYLDITKDRLYTMPTESLGRRSAQSAMYRILEALVRWLAPILSFTAEEIWQHMPGARSESVLFETWYDGLVNTQGAPKQRNWWSNLLEFRKLTFLKLEDMRNDGEIGSSLEAKVDIYLDDAKFLEYQPYAEELRFFFISSEFKLNLLPPEMKVLEDVLKSGMVHVSASASEAAKCIRCWHRREDVGSNPAHPEICSRCVSNVEGPGENRHWF